MSVISVYVVFADAKEAETIARTVVEERLAACANILGSVHSIYRWHGEVKAADEVAAIFKTHHWQSEALMERIAALHSYEIPCIVVWPIDRVLASYASWVKESVA